MSLVLESRHRQVAVLAINRPEKRNAMTPQLQEALVALLRKAESDEDVGVVVITGSGRDFCVGGDFEVARQMQESSDSWDELQRVHAMIADCVLSLAKPTIAAINGAAYGFGAELAAFCDMVVMSEDATLADPHVKLGLGPAPGALLVWPQLTSRAIAAELLLTGRSVTAAEAHRLGLANRVAPAGEALAAALDLADEICALPREGVLAARRALRRSYTGLLADAGIVIAPNKGVEAAPPPG
ncbi:MAG: enoyl-CoA hydratase/isomerase family protein [Novosphingobium sp.]|nr:enoyl-CoA hydratase/isomerase family protein [Novosphingobium sp.]